MTVGIVGLGLIGGSFAKAYKEAGHTVYAWNRTKSVTEFAKISEIISAELTAENLGECDIVLVSLYPEASIEWMEKMGPHFGKKPIVIDCCGTKRIICREGFRIAKKYGFTFVGGHPMAGTQYSGLKYARANMFVNAPMVIVPPDFDDIRLLSRIKELLKPTGIGRITVTTAEKHDEMIAFTSQLAHVVSNAYIKSPTAMAHKGFSAGSYKDMTRVAWLNPEMWAELFIDNKDNLEKELDLIINSLSEYKQAIHNSDSETLIKLLADGKRIKEEVDGR